MPYWSDQVVDGLLLETLDVLTGPGIFRHFVGHNRVLLPATIGSRSR